MGFPLASQIKKSCSPAYLTLLASVHHSPSPTQVVPLLFSLSKKRISPPKNLHNKTVTYNILLHHARIYINYGYNILVRIICI